MPLSNASSHPPRQRPYSTHCERAEAEADGGKIANQTPCLYAQPWRLGVDAADRKADFADLAARPGRGDLSAPVTSNDQAAGIDIRQIITPGPRRRRSGRGDFPHRYCLAGEQRFIALQIMRREHDRIGGHTVAFGKNDEVAADDFGAGYSFLDAVADDKRARAGQIAQAFEHTLGAGFLNDGNENRGAGKKAEHDSFFEIAEEEIDDGRAE